MRLAILIPLLLAISGCATNPVTRQSEVVLITEKGEQQLGRELASMVSRQLPLLPASDPLYKYVDKVGRRLAATSDRPDLDFSFNVVDDGNVNAFALPGGYVYVHRGLLVHLNSEAELAAVLGHEIGHIAAHHHAMQWQSRIKAYSIGITVSSIIAGIPYGVDELTSLLVTAMVTGYGKKQELEADELALKYLANGGYSAKASINLLATIERLDAIDERETADASRRGDYLYHSVFSTYPGNRSRIKEIVDQAAALQQTGIYKVGRDAMLDEIDGYAVGNNENRGTLVGQRYIQPKLGYQIELPGEWIIRDTPGSLTATVRQQQAYFALSQKSVEPGTSAEAVLESLFPATTRRDRTTGTLNGYAYASSSVYGEAGGLDKAAISATVFIDGGNAFVMLLYCRRSDEATFKKLFDEVRASFRRYRQPADHQVPRIVIQLWNEGESWQKLAAKSGQILGPLTAERLATLNGMDTDRSPKAGEPFKFVR